MRRFAWIMLGAVVVLGGCSPYAMRGRVIEGHRASVEVVSRDDPRLTLQEPGLADAMVSVTLDPEKLNARSIGSGVSDATGNFAIAVDVAGAGVLLHDVEVLAQRQKFFDASSQFVLPGKNQRVLITMTTGTQKRVDERPLLERTLEEAQPYLRE
ncbi:MAG: hypothetical protein AAGF84_02320 [Planctomycetota bacterium]